MAESIFEEIEQNIIITIDDVILLKSESKRFKQRRLSWKLFVEKIVDCDGDSLNFALEMLRFNSAGESQNFSCIAMAVLELELFGEREPHVVQFGPFEFSPVNPKYSMKLIGWDNLMDPVNRFVEGNQMKLEVLIKADERKLFEEQTVGKLLSIVPEGVRKFRHTFNKVGRCLASVSPEFDGFPMRMKLFKNHSVDERDSWLGIYFWNWRKSQANNGDEVVQVQAKIRLLSTDPQSIPPVERNIGIITLTQPDKKRAVFDNSSVGVNFKQNIWKQMVQCRWKLKSKESKKRPAPLKWKWHPNPN